MSATETRRRLAEYHLFIELVGSVVKAQGNQAEELRLTLSRASEFLQHASSREIRERGQELEALLEQGVRLSEMLLPRKKGVREIARDFRLLIREEPDVWRFGIQSGWLSDRFDLSRLSQFEDLPRHARVGIGHHAGGVAIEEGSLLGDAYFLLLRARESFDAMMRFARVLEKGVVKAADSYREMSSLSSSVCTYSRLGVLTSVAFVEAFVNSIGWSEAAVRSDLSEQQKGELRGSLKGRYLSLESKLERFPRILREDKISPIIVSDERQMREPFARFIRETKAVRDAAMHFAPGKAPIFYPPKEWLVHVETAVRCSVDVAREFWSACFPCRQQPIYLAGLYYDGLLRQAVDRTTAAESAALRSTTESPAQI